MTADFCKIADILVSTDKAYAEILSADCMLSWFAGRGHRTFLYIPPKDLKKLDKAAKRNILPKNTASRRKARFAKLLSAKKA